MDSCPTLSRSLPSALHGLLLALGLLVGAAWSEAAIVFYRLSLDQEAFESAVGDAALDFLGRESFSGVEPEQADLIPASFLAPGIPAGAFFPSGTAPALGFLLQSNRDGAVPSTLNPGGQLYASRAQATEGPGWVGPNLSRDSLDLVVDPPQPRGFARAVAFDVNLTGGQDLQLKVLDNTNSVIAETTLHGVGQDRIAVVVTGQPLFRLNLFAPTGFFDVRELDLYTAPLAIVPEPRSLALLVGLVALGLGMLRRPRRPTVDSR